LGIRTYTVTYTVLSGFLRKPIRRIPLAMMTSTPRKAGWGAHLEKKALHLFAYLCPNDARGQRRDMGIGGG
jgi:hypothetical protein